MLKNVIKDEHIIAICLSIILLFTIIAAFNVFLFKPEDIENNISTQLQIKEELLKTSKFPEVTSSIFSPLLAMNLPVKIEQPKNQPVVQVDPYDVYKTDLKTYQIFGFNKDNDNIVTVFLSKGDNTFTLKKGDKFDDKYIVKDILEKEVIIGLINDDKFEFKITQN